MLRRVSLVIAAVVVLGVGYLCAWPVPIDPVAWTPSADPGFTGAFAENNGLSAAELLPIGPAPEDVAIGPDGHAYAGLLDGRIVRVGDGTVLANTGGRPLGMEFAPDGSLVVADAHRGLLRVRAGAVEVLATTCDGVPFGFTDDVTVAPDGTIYFTDASWKFGLGLSAVDYLEHRGNGRLLVHTPAGETRTLQRDLNFANGITLAHDGRSLLFTETFTYRVWRRWLQGPKAGTSELLVDGLPGFPDNIDRGPEGTYWLALVKPRSPRADALAGSPFARKVLMRLPEAMLPLPERRGMVVQIDEAGRVLRTLQDPSGRVAVTTSAILHRGFLLVGSYEEPHLARVKWP